MTNLSPLVADLSDNNPTPDFHAYRQAGHCCVAIKATEGTSYVNPTHREWCLEFGRLGVAIIHYHFARPDLGDSPVSEAEHFLQTALPLAGGRDFLFLDFERGLPAGFARDAAWAHEFAATVHAHSRFRCGLYGSRSWLEQSDEWLPDNGPRWTWDADWSTGRDYTPPGYTPALRQFTDGAFGPEPHSLPGIGIGDINIMRGRFLQAVLAHQH